MLENNYYGLFYYSPIWSVIGFILLGCAVSIVIAIFYATRRKEVRQINHLKIHPPKTVDLNALKQKYLGLVEQIDNYYNDHRLSASVAHQQLSKAVRMFYYEALGFHADVMTLSDLKRSTRKDLTKVIEKYYPDEFDMLEQGLVAQSAERARELIEGL